MKLKNIYSSCVAVLIAMSLCCSCADSTQEVDMALNSRCAITSFILGNLVRTICTEDTTYQAFVPGTMCPMSIDQQTRRIYNITPFPFGTDITKVKISKVTCDGYLYYMDNDDNIILYNSDSLDFTSPRKFLCVSSDRTSQKEYDVTINVYKAEPEQFVWDEIDDSFTQIFKSVTSQKAFLLNEEPIVMAISDNKPVIIKCIEGKWQATEMQNIGIFEPDKIMQWNNTFYVIVNGVIKKSEDGTNWTDITLKGNAELQYLVATSNSYLYAVNKDSIYYSADAETWKTDSIDNNNALLPAKDVNYIYSQMAFNSDFYYIMITGTDKEGKTAIWKKIINTKEKVNNEQWTYYPATDEIRYTYPTDDKVVAFNYDNKIYAIGCKDGTLSPFYISSDNGRTWIPQTEQYIHPDGINANSLSCVVDKDNYIWIFCGESGKVWKGRLNRLKN